MKAVVGTLEECNALRAAIDKSLGFPRKGVQVGGGIHVDQPDDWDGNGECPPGWTATAVQIVEPTGDDKALPPIVELPDDIAVELAKPEAREKLDVVERVVVAEALAARTEKDASAYYPKSAAVVDAPAEAVEASVKK